MATENWLLKMEKLLRALECTDAQKMVYATFSLQGSAERWWSCTEPLLRMELGGNTLITWEKFKEVFNETYFPDGTMIVEEYAAKFVELSHFAPYLIPDKPKKAMSLEEDFKCNLGSKNNEKKQEPSSFQHGKGQGKIFMKGFFKKLGNGDHSNGQDKGAFPQSSGKKPCSYCDRFHNGYACGGVKLCYNCKKRGHFAKECPITRGSSSSSLPQTVKGNNNGKMVQGRVYAFTAQNAQAMDTMVKGMDRLASRYACINI
ncbi:uncharacterized protein LOC126721748 [Quercus robur]|uniref:uncharacterized protein LOC126721748 n=1 Tax=Quercus robur TaxID=38942 RepID=UPI00216284B5|nr:uncharacterized protein LOC126721748 [Quercus robur]